MKKATDKLTKHQKEIVNGIISEFTKMNEVEDEPFSLIDVGAIKQLHVDKQNRIE